MTVAVVLAVLLLVGVAVVLAGVVASPRFRRLVRRSAQYCWRYGRNLPAMWSARRRWRSLAASCHLGTWKSSTVDGVTKQQAYGTPTTSRWRLTPAGWSFIVRHPFGMTIEDVRSAAGGLASGFKAAQVRVVGITTKNGQVRRDRCRVLVNRRDPFARVAAPLAISTTRVRLGVLEDGQDWIYDARTDPHVLGAGRTGSGKSSLQNTLLAGLAPLDDVAVVLVDLKHGVSAEPYRARASVVAETQAEAAGLFADLLALGQARAALCKVHRVESVYDLPGEVRSPGPDGRSGRVPEVYVVIDEVGELTHDDGTTEGKALSKAVMRDLLRSVSLLRAFGVHVWVLGQRFGSSLGPQITSIRAQLPGRICLAVADRETGDMAVGDIAVEAVRAALDITMPGVCVVSGGPDRWQLARAAHTSHQALAEIAAEHAHKRLSWASVMERPDIDTAPPSAMTMDAEAS